MKIEQWASYLNRFWNHKIGLKMFWRLAQHNHRKLEILAQFAAVKSVCWQRGSCVGDKSSFLQTFPRLQNNQIEKHIAENSAQFSGEAMNENWTHMIGQVHILYPGICDHVTMQINSTKCENESACAAQYQSDVALILVLITSEMLFRALVMHQ